MEKNNEKLKDIIPGFRTNILWKKVVAVFGYIFLIFVFVAILTSPSEYGNRADASIEKIYNAVTALMIIGIPFVIITNFMGVRDKLPLFKKHKIGFTILGSFITYIVIAIGCSVMAMTATGLYSEEYFADMREAKEQREMEEAEKKEEVEEEAKRKAEEEKTKEEAERKEEEKKAKEEAERKEEEEKKAKEEAERKAEEEEKAKDTLNEYIFADSDNKYLTEDEILRVDVKKLKIARNEIFARHGYIFKSEDLKKNFESTSWYKGTIKADKFNSDKVFNDFEKKNVELIKRVEDEINGVADTKSFIGIKGEYQCGSDMEAGVISVKSIRDGIVYMNIGTHEYPYLLENVEGEIIDDHTVSYRGMTFVWNDVASLYVLDVPAGFSDVIWEGLDYLIADYYHVS